MQEILNRSPKVYDRFEKEAAELLEKATDAAMLREVADRYPNSEAAATALRRQHRNLKLGGDPATAAQLLESLYLQYPSAGRRGATVESLTRIALAGQKDPARALAFAASGARLYPQYRLANPILGVSTFGEVAAALREQVKPVLPRIGLPGIAATGDYRRQGKGAIAAVTDNAADQLQGVRSIIRSTSVSGASPGGQAVVMMANGDVACVKDGASIVWKEPLGDASGRGFVAGGWVGTGAVAHWVGYSTSAFVGVASPDKSRATWSLKLADLPVVDTAPARAEVQANPQVNVVNVAIQPGLGLPIPGGQIFGLAGGEGRRMPARGAEEIVSAKILSDRIVAFTSVGRIVCVSTDNGKVLWQSQLSEGSYRRLLVSETFAVVLSTAANGIHVRAQVYSVTDGVEWDDFIVSDSELVNATLSPDGLLIYTLPNQICARDLFRPDEGKPAFEAAVPASACSGMTAPGQLLAWEGLVLAMTDKGYLVRAFVTAEGGAPLKLPAGSPGDPTSGAISTGGRPAGDSLSQLIVGDHLYIRGQRSVMSYDLRRGGENWRVSFESFGPTRGAAAVSTPIDLTVASDFVLAATAPVQSKDKWTARLTALSREPDKTGKESGFQLHTLVLPDVDVTNLATQAVDGGVYYVAKGNTLHFLRANTH